MLPVIRKKDGGFLSSLRKNQASLDDFHDENGFLLIFLHSEVLFFQALVHNSPLVTASRIFLWINCRMLYPIVLSHISLV